jgi:hypothetical protein
VGAEEMQTEKQHVSKFSKTQMSKYWYIVMLCLGLVACKQTEPASLSPKAELSFKLDGQSVTLDSLWVKETYTLGNTKIFYLVAQRYDKQTLIQELRIVLPAFKSKDILTLPYVRGRCPHRTTSCVSKDIVGKIWSGDS